MSYRCASFAEAVACRRANSNEHSDVAGEKPFARAV